MIYITNFSLPLSALGSYHPVYKYYTGEPLWPFGFGLSYTSFTLDWTPAPPPLTTYTFPTSATAENARATAAALASATTTYTVEVTNTGKVSQRLHC
jgi:beta-D-xylosidase 4